MTEAEFILKTADELDIRVGTDGTELVAIFPPRLSREVWFPFERALFRHKREIIDSIMREEAMRQVAEKRP